MLHSGDRRPHRRGSARVRAPSGTQESLRGGSRLLAGQGGASARRRKHVQRPATRHHSRSGARHRRARGFTSSEPCSTTSPPGSFPAAHVARTELNDRQPKTVPAASGPFSGRGWYSVAHPDTTPPTRQRFHPQSAAHHPPTGHSAQPAWSGHHTDKLLSVISHHLRYVVRTPGAAVDLGTKLRL